MINQARDNYENQIQDHFEQHLTPELLLLLTDLFEQYLPDNQKTAAQNSPFKLTKLRVKSELMKVKVIRENVADLRALKSLYERFLPILKALELSDNFVEELAIQVLRSRSPQVKRWKNRNLYLICFIQYQYFYLSDVLTQTFTKAVEQNINLCEKTYKIQRQEQQEANIEQLIPILESYLLQGELIENMQKIVLGLNHTQPEKIKTIANGLRDNITEDFIRLLPAVKKLYLQTTRQTQDEGYFNQIAEGSQKMQMKVGDMLRYLSFSGQKALQEAIDFYSKMFTATPAKVREGYANFAIVDPPLKLVLIETPRDAMAEYQHLNHLGVELETTDQVESSIERFEQLGLVDSVEKDTTCCFAVQDKVWMQSPDGAPWEFYTVLADAPTYYATADQKCC